MGKSEAMRNWTASWIMIVLILNYDGRGKTDRALNNVVCKEM